MNSMVIADEAVFSSLGKLNVIRSTRQFLSIFKAHRATLPMFPSSPRTEGVLGAALLYTQWTNNREVANA